MDEIENYPRLVGSFNHNFKDRTGERHGRLTVLYPTERRNGQLRWLCLCDCGNHTVVNVPELTSGDTTSCGCRLNEIHNEHKFKKTHGMSDTPIFKEWTGIKDRCLNPKCKAYSGYGGRGIKICEKWMKFEDYYADVSTLPHFGEAGYSLNRIDNDGDYEPSNVEWADWYTQANNTRSNHYEEYNGEVHTLAEWSRIKNIPYDTLEQRIRVLHWSIERALNEPVRKR